MDSGAGTGRNAVERALRQGESLDEEVVVLGTIRSVGWFYNDDWQCRGACAVGLSALNAKGQDGVHRHQRMVLSGGKSAEGATPDLRVGQYLVGNLLAQPHHATHHRHRCMAGHWHCQALPRKGFPPIYSDYHNPVGCDDVDLVQKFLYPLESTM